MSAFARGSCLAVPRWALVVLALLVVASGAAPAHVHTDVSPGLYNTAHVLENFAARSAAVSVPEALPAGVAEAPAQVKPVAAESIPSAPVLRGPDSRSPPTA
ncbi:MAG: hypothetical protein ABW020_05060 [Candidatus Rokuibacteriota bacterium]